MLFENVKTLSVSLQGIFENKPCLSVLPRRVVTSGENVTFKCFSQEEYYRFIVIKEGEQMHSMIMESQKTSAGQFQTLFFVGPLTSSSSVGHSNVMTIARQTHRFGQNLVTTWKYKSQVRQSHHCPNHILKP